MIELHEAYVRGDLAAVKDLLGDPPDFPNCRGPSSAACWRSGPIPTTATTPAFLR
jgi:hypothetical protein